MSIKVERLSSMLQREIADIVANEMRDEDVRFVTITYLKLASDLSYAKIYVTTLIDEKKDKVIRDLNHAEGFIKSELYKRKLEIRKIPSLEFVYDDSIDHGIKIERLIKEMNEK